MLPDGSRPYTNMESTAAMQPPVDPGDSEEASPAEEI